MNELNRNTHERELLHDYASIELEQLLTCALPRHRLLPLVTERVKLALARYAQGMHGSGATAEAMAATKVAEHLQAARAIPLEPQLCTLMARVGFDKALFTYGSVDGVAFGYAEGDWLLKFVAATQNEPAPPDWRPRSAAPTAASRASA